MTTAIAIGEMFTLNGDDGESTQSRIQREWIGGVVDQDGNLLAFDDAPVTLKLTGLPLHGALIISGYDLTDYDIKVNGVAVGSADLKGNSLSYVVQQTGHEADIELAPNYSGAYSLPDLSVAIDTPSLGMESLIMTVGDTSPVTVFAQHNGVISTAEGDDNAWWFDLTVALVVKAGKSVIPASTLTIAGGQRFATALLDAVAAGATALVAQVAAVGAKSQPAEETSVQIVNALERPTPGKVKRDLKGLDADNFQTRQKYQEELQLWLQQFPDLRDTYVAERPNLPPEAQNRDDAILAHQTLAVTLAGNQLQLICTPAAGVAGQFLQGLATFKGGDSIGFKTHGGDFIDQITISTAGPSGTVELMAKGEGEETIVIKFRVTWRDDDGEPHSAEYTSELQLRATKKAASQPAP